MKFEDAMEYSKQLGRVKGSRRLQLELAHGMCKRSQVVTVADVPPRVPFSKWGTFIEKVYTLPKGRGLVTPTIHDQGLAKRRAFSIHARGRDIGKPVTCLVRFCDVGRIRGWRVFVFRRTDVTKRRNGKEHKG
jgi:hypothetical protein